MLIFNKVLRIQTNSLIKRIFFKLKIYIFPRKTLVNKKTPYKKIKYPKKTHSFAGYYDRSPFYADKYLFLATDCEDYLLRNNVASIFVYDNRLNTYSKISDVQAWNFQQASQQQWLENDKIIFNDVTNGNPVCKICNLEGEIIKTFDFNIGHISKDRKATVYDYSKLYEYEHEYGYANISSNSMSLLSIIDLDSGKTLKNFSHEDIAKTYPVNSYFENTIIWVNHPKFNKSGSKLLFVVRSKHNNIQRSDLFVFDFASEKLFCALMWNDWKLGGHHPVWYDENEILMNLCLSEESDMCFIRFSDFYKGYTVIAPDIKGSGHPTISPNKKFLITDTYPNREGIQNLRLIDLASNKEISLGEFFSPPRFRKRFGTDLHPRWINNSLICFDSTMDKNRGVYLIDISSLI